MSVGYDLFNLKPCNICRKAIKLGFVADLAQKRPFLSDKNFDMTTLNTHRPYTIHL